MNRVSKRKRLFEFDEWVWNCVHPFCDKRTLHILCSLNLALRKKNLPFFSKNVVFCMEDSPLAKPIYQKMMVPNINLLSFQNFRKDFLEQVDIVSVQMDWWLHVEEKQLFNVFPKLSSLVIRTYGPYEYTIPYSFPSSLTVLKFPDAGRVYLNISHFPPNLKVLDLGRFQKYQVLPVFPASLHTLKLNYGFIPEQANCLEHLTQLSKLTVLNNTKLVIPSTVVYLKVNNVSPFMPLPPNLHTFKFSLYDCTDWILPTSIQRLRIMPTGQHYEITLPENHTDIFPNLSNLTIYGDVTHILKPRHLPRNLIELEISQYNKDLEPGVLPDSLRKIRFVNLHCDYLDFRENVFPKGLTELTLGRKHYKFNPKF